MQISEGLVKGIKLRGNEENIEPNTAKHLLGILSRRVSPSEKHLRPVSPPKKTSCFEKSGHDFHSIGLLDDVFDPFQKHRANKMSHWFTCDFREQFPHHCDVFHMAKRILQQIVTPLTWIFDWILLLRTSRAGAENFSSLYFSLVSQETHGQIFALFEHHGVQIRVNNNNSSNN